MEDLINEIVKAVSPMLVEIVAVVFGVIIAKLGGVLRAWKLGQHVSGGSQAARERVLALEAAGVIDADLAEVLLGAIGAFALNAAQIDTAIADGLAQFGQDLQNPPQTAE